LLFLLLIRRRRKRLRATNCSCGRNDGFWEDKESIINIWTINSGQISTNLSSKIASLTSSLVCSLSAMLSFGEYHACALLCCEKLRWVCRTPEIFVTNDRKYQTLRLIFVVHDTSDKNPEYFPRRLGFLSHVIGHEWEVCVQPGRCRCNLH
jgi:hypothetical protein